MLKNKIFQLILKIHVSLYRLSNGKVGSQIGGMGVILLTTTGCKSGKARTVPLMYIEDDSTYVICASYAGSDKHPAWFLNLQSNPDVHIQVGNKTTTAQAKQATPEEKARLWPRFVEKSPDFEKYQQKTSRNIPLVILSPTL